MVPLAAVASLRYLHPVQPVPGGVQVYLRKGLPELDAAERRRRRSSHHQHQALSSVHQHGEYGYIHTYVCTCVGERRISRFSPDTNKERELICNTFVERLSNAFSIITQLEDKGAMKASIYIESVRKKVEGWKWASINMKKSTLCFRPTKTTT